ncbi:MAG TPA: hypothetical protein VEI97_10515, partial [bacterium]|nr:hypothetical protein [bacterium]
MRKIVWGPVAALALIAGCAGGDHSPLAPVGAGLPQGGAQLGAQAVDGDLAQSALALFTVTVDPGTQSATTRLKQTRAAQQTDDLYELSIGNFITDSTLSVESVQVTPTTIELHYSVTHPFKAPTDLDAAPTRTNRADLAVSGRVAFLMDVADASGNTFFANDGNVVANTGIILNADGYYTPAGLLTLSGFTANTFPYKVLVDETLDPRFSQADGLPRSNGGSSTGNYNPNYGWQRDTMGSLHDAWAGYGVLHHGQSAFNTLSINRDAVEDGARFSFDAAIIVKYEDPRGGVNSREKRSNRLPPPSPDLTRFVYRMPHGALDVERISFLGEAGSFQSNQISGSELRFKVVDWDARATVTAAADLHEDVTSASTVAPGEPGAPTLAVCIPGVLGGPDAVVALSPVAQMDDDTLNGGDLTPDTGLPGDALYYRETVSKAVTSGQTDGTYVGM